MVLIPTIQAAVDDTEPLDNTVKLNRVLNKSVFVINTTNQGLAGATCTGDIFNDQNIKVLDDASLFEVGEGFYTFSINSSVTNVTGTFFGFVICTSGGLTATSAFDFKVVQATTIDEIDEVEETVIVESQELEDTIDEAESEIKENQQETNEFIANTINFLNSEMAKGFFLVIVILTVIGLIVLGKRLRSKKNMEAFHG